MKVKYFSETDTLFIQLSNRPISETRDLKEFVQVDLDADGKVVSMTVEHAQAEAGRLDFSYETVPA